MAQEKGYTKRVGQPSSGPKSSTNPVSGKASDVLSGTRSYGGTPIEPRRTRGAKPEYAREQPRTSPGTLDLRVRRTLRRLERDGPRPWRSPAKSMRKPRVRKPVVRQMRNFSKRPKRSR